MGRPRKHDRGLPAYVRVLSGAYYYRGKKLCRVDEGESAMYDALAKRKALPSVETVPAAVAKFKLKCLSKLTHVVAKEHGRLLDIFADDFKAFRVDQVDSVAVKKSILHHFDGKPSAARHYKSRISTFFRWCIADEGLVKINPCSSVWLDKPPKSKMKWTPELFWKVHDKLDPMKQCYHLLSFLTYQRTTDVRLLRREQNRDGVVHFAPSKTINSSGKEVDIPVTSDIQRVLDRAFELAKEIAKKKKIISPYIIQSRQGGPFTRSGIYSAYRRADEEIHGVDKIIGLNPKALRPFAATMAKKQGHTTEQLKDGMTHVLLSTTEGYIQQFEVPVSEVLMKLPERPKPEGVL